jgi:hypothetical protein
MPANFTTLPHLSVSPPMRLFTEFDATGVIGNGTLLKSAI